MVARLQPLGCKLQPQQVFATSATQLKKRNLYFHHNLTKKIFATFVKKNIWQR
jgi:hypothetical protein